MSPTKGFCDRCTLPLSDVEEAAGILCVKCLLVLDAKEKTMATQMDPKTPIQDHELPPLQDADREERRQEQLAALSKSERPGVHPAYNLDPMRYWNKLKDTPKECTKDRDMPWGKITTINPHWQKLRMTQTFGPIGQGWGHNLVKSETLEVDGNLIREVTVAVWVQFPDTRGEWHAVGSDFYKRGGKPRIDKDAGKKAYTDALTKAFSDIGMSADIFLSDLGNFQTTYDDPDAASSGRRDVQTPTPRPMPTRRPPPRRQPQRSDDGNGNQEQDLWNRTEQKFRDWYFRAKKVWGGVGYEWTEFDKILEEKLSPGTRMRRKEADGWKLSTRDLKLDDFKAMAEARDYIEKCIHDARAEQEG